MHQFFVEQSWRPTVSIYWEVILPDTLEGRETLHDYIRSRSFGVAHNHEYTDSDDDRRELARLVIDWHGDWADGDAKPKVRELGLSYDEDDVPNHFETLGERPCPTIPHSAWSNIQRVLYGNDEPLVALHYSLLPVEARPTLIDGDGI